MRNAPSSAFRRICAAIRLRSTPLEISPFSQAMNTDESKYGLSYRSALTKTPNVILRGKVASDVGVSAAQRGYAWQPRLFSQRTELFDRDSHWFSACVRMQSATHHHAITECGSLVEKIRFAWNVAEDQIRLECRNGLLSSFCCDRPRIADHDGPILSPMCPLRIRAIHLAPEATL